MIRHSFMRFLHSFHCLYVSLVDVQISNPSFFSYTTAPNSHHFVSASNTRDIMSLDTLAAEQEIRSVNFNLLPILQSQFLSLILSFRAGHLFWTLLFSVPIPGRVNKFSLSAFSSSLCLGHLHWRQSVTAALLAMLTMKANRQSSLSFCPPFSNTRSHP